MIVFDSSAYKIKSPIDQPQQTVKCLKHIQKSQATIPPTKRRKSLMDIDHKQILWRTNQIFQDVYDYAANEKM